MIKYFVKFLCIKINYSPNFGGGIKMSGKKELLSLLFLYFIFWLGFNGCQTFGKLYTIQEVNQLHGPVIEKVAFGRPQFQAFLTKTNNLLMFTFKDDKLFIAGDERKVIYPDSASISLKDTLKVFSKSNVEELLNRGPADSVYVEKRSKTISITYDNSTLEFPVRCPPFCG